MVVMAHIMVNEVNDRPSVWGTPILMRGDNSSAVAWVHKCGGTYDPRAAALMRILGCLEMVGGWCFEAKHIAGVANTVAGGISRWPRGEISERLIAERPDIAWQEIHVGESAGALCFEILREYSRKSELLRRLSTLTERHGTSG